MAQIAEQAKPAPDVEVQLTDFPELEGQTIIHIRYFAPSYYENGGWVCINPTTFLIGPDGSCLRMLAAYNIPLSPQKFHFQHADQCLRFTLLFPKVPEGWKQFMMTEECASGSGFVIRDIDVNRDGVYAFSIRYHS